jgi:hypothetical protein
MKICPSSSQFFRRLIGYQFGFIGLKLELVVVVELLPVLEELLLVLVELVVRLVHSTDRLQVRLLRCLELFHCSPALLVLSQTKLKLINKVKKIQLTFSYVWHGGDLKHRENQNDDS